MLEKEEHSMDQLEATHQREQKDARYFGIPEQVQDKDLKIKKEKIAQILEGCQSLLQYYNDVQIARSVLCKAEDPTLHCKMKADKVYDGSGERLQRRYVYTEKTTTQTRRHQKQKQKQRQKQTVISDIVNIETDAQAE